MRPCRWLVFDRASSACASSSACVPSLPSETRAAALARAGTCGAVRPVVGGSRAAAPPAPAGICCDARPAPALAPLALAVFLCLPPLPEAAAAPAGDGAAGDRAPDASVGVGAGATACEAPQWPTLWPLAKCVSPRWRRRCGCCCCAAGLPQLALQERASAARAPAAGIRPGWPEPAEFGCSRVACSAPHPRALRAPGRSDGAAWLSVVAPRACACCAHSRFASLQPPRR